MCKWIVESPYFITLIPLYLKYVCFFGTYVSDTGD